MEIKQNLCGNAKRKAGLLVKKACDLDMDVMGYGEVGENQSNGNIYLWLEDYPFSLYIDLGSDEIKACWSSFETGEEEIIAADNLNLDDLLNWAENLNAEEYRKAEATE